MPTITTNAKLPGNAISNIVVYIPKPDVWLLESVAESIQTARTGYPAKYDPTTNFREIEV